eukprot:gene1422-2028_t
MSEDLSNTHKRPRPISPPRQVEALVVDLEVVEDLLVEVEVVVDLEVVESASLARPPAGTPMRLALEVFPWFEEEKEEIKPLLWEIPHP